MSSNHLFDEMKDQGTRGVLLVLTGPTGAGKDTLFEKLLQEDSNIIKITTTTSRDMRPHESEGNPYHFISRESFEKKIAEGEFFEWVEFRGHLYGTEKETIQKALASHHDVIWHIDAKGIKNIKEKVKEMVERSVFVFLAAPSVETLKKRVENDKGQIEHRWNESLVSWEVEQYDDCDYLVINEDNKIDQAVSQVKAIMQSKRLELL